MQVHESSVIIELFQEEAPKVCELDSLRGGITRIYKRKNTMSSMQLSLPEEHI